MAKNHEKQVQKIDLSFSTSIELKLHNQAKKKMHSMLNRYITLASIQIAIKIARRRAIQAPKVFQSLKQPQKLDLKKSLTPKPKATRELQ